jgi:hypothetical protein
MRNARDLLLLSFISVVVACGGSQSADPNSGSQKSDAAMIANTDGATSVDAKISRQDVGTLGDTAPRTKADAGSTADGSTDMRPTGATPDGGAGVLPIDRGAVLASGQEADNVDAYKLAAGADGSVYVAGFTSDWARLGITNPGRAAVSFVARIATSGKVAWATALPANWWPNAAALDGDELIVVSASLDSPAVQGSCYSSTYAVARVSAQGALADSKTFDYPDTVVPSAVVVDGDHFIHVAASSRVTDASSNTTETLELARLSPDLSVESATKFPHTGRQARINALHLGRNGDLLLAGYFDDSVDFGGSPLQTKNLGSWYSCAGFFARLTPKHGYVTAKQIGGDDFADVSDVVEKDGSIYLGGAITGAVTLDGISVTAASESSGFVAKLNAQGKTEWVNVWPGRSWVQAVVAGTKRVIAGGSIGDSRYIVQDVLDKPAQPDEAFLTLNTEKFNPMTLAAGGGGFWLSLGFHDQVTLTPKNTQVQGKASTLLLRFEE